jgi:uncharacterized protein
MTTSEQAIARSINSKKLELILLPTEKCNFRCTYCYETFEHGRMRPWVVRSLHKLIDIRTRDLSSLKLNWFGGEPLLESKLMVDFASYALQTCLRNDCELAPGEVTTNGYLLSQEVFEKLIATNHRLFQVSLDGDEKGHETSRRHIAGHPTFQRIMKNLENLKLMKHEFRVVVRLHLLPTNRDSMLRLAEQIRGTLLTDARYGVLIKAVGDWGGPLSGTFKALNADEARSRAAELRSALGLNEASPQETIDPSKGESAYVCYAASANSLLIRADGRVGKCTTALDDSLNTVGQLNPDGTIRFNSQNLNFWLTGLQTRQPAHLACPYHAVPRTDRRIVPILRA